MSILAPNYPADSVPHGPFKKEKWNLDPLATTRPGQYLGAAGVFIQMS